MKSAWESIRKRRARSAVSKSIWNSLVPLKVSLFVWAGKRKPVDETLKGRCVMSLPILDQTV